MNQAEYNELLPLLSDIEWRLDNLYYIKDKHGKIVKFVRNESQLELWNNRHTLSIILKDRQRGFSTFIAILILDTCIFNSNQECGIIDITLPDGKKKIAKIKLGYDRLPEQIKEERKLITDNKETLEWSNGSTVYTGTSHRGGTLQILHISELGKISARNPEKAREIRTGAMNTLAPGRFIFIESTAEGKAGEFYENCQTAIKLKEEGAFLTDLDFKFFFFGWWMDGNENELDPEHVTVPAKLTKYFDKLEDSLGITINARKRAWYTKKSAQQKGDMFREFPATQEEAFDASIEGAYLSSILLKMRNNNQIGLFLHDPEHPVNSAWDFGVSASGLMAIWFHQYVALQHRLIGYVSGYDLDIDYYWRQMQALPYTWGNHFMPHDAKNKRIGTALPGRPEPRTLEDIAKAQGMRNIQTVPRVAHKGTAITEAKLLLPQCFISTVCDVQPGWSTEKKDKYHGGIQCLKNFRRKWNEDLGCYDNRPTENWAMHGYDAFETLARGINEFGLRRLAPVQKESWRDKLKNRGGSSNGYMAA